METTTDLYSKAAAELESIDRQIAALESRRIELRQFVELGRKLFTAAPANLFVGSRAAPQPSQHSFGELLRAHVARENSLKANVLALSRELLQATPYATTAALVNYIEGKGITVTGKDKNVTVSVILSRSPDFVSDRTRGWSLAKKNPQDVAASAGSSTA